MSEATEQKIKCDCGEWTVNYKFDGYNVDTWEPQTSITIRCTKCGKGVVIPAAVAGGGEYFVKIDPKYAAEVRAEERARVLAELAGENKISIPALYGYETGVAEERAKWAARSAGRSSRVWAIKRASASAFGFSIYSPSTNLHIPLMPPKPA